MIPRRLYLVRHGATLGGAGRYIGNIDLPLSSRGENEAMALRRYLAGVDFQAVYCSDLGRSIRSAQLIAGTDSPTPHPGLREVAMGQWEGLSHAEAATRFPDDYRRRGENLAEYGAPGGESFAQCRARATLAIREILAECHGDVLIVAHAGVNRVLLCHWLGMRTNDMFRLGQDTGCLNLVLLTPAPRVQVMNFRPGPFTSAV